MIRASLLRRFSILALFPAFLALMLGVGGCDNPSCIFGAGGCGGGNPTIGLGSEPAELPVDGSEIADAAPTVVSVFPSGASAHPGTVVAIEVSESLAQASLVNAFEIVESSFGAPVPIVQPPPLVGDGHIVILSPLTPLMEGSSYVVRRTAGSVVTDLTGQPLAINPTVGGDMGDGGEDLGNFAVAAMPAVAPSVIATWPPDASAGQSDLTQVAVVFDRKMDATTFGTDSFVFTVDDLPPAENPPPFALVVTAGAVPVPIEQVWLYRSTGSDLQPVSLGASAAAELVLSPASDPLEDQDGGVLPATTITFTTAATTVPAMVFKNMMSAPDDAIGAPNLAGTDPVVQVELDAMTQTGDALGVFLFGQGPMTDDPLIALFRRVPITTPTMTVLLAPADLGLLSSQAPVIGRFADGDLTIAVRLERGTTSSAVRLFDADVDGVPGPQPVLFDVTAPQLVGLSGSGTDTTAFASDVRDLVVVGRANEELRSVEVVATGFALDNGVLAPVVASDAAGLFIAAPVTLGLIEPGMQPVDFTLTIYDRALNFAPTVMAEFTQLGVVSPSTAFTGTIDVDVFDAATLAPLSGALVIVNEDDGLGTITDVGQVTTDADGHATISGLSAGFLTLVTVDLAGYDLFTFHDVRGVNLQVPLHAQGVTDASVEGRVRSEFTVNFSTETNQIADTRMATPGDPLFAVDGCSLDQTTFPFSYNCPFGPQVLTPRRLGARSFLAADFDVTLMTFSAAGFLKAFDLGLPARALAPAEEEEDEIIIAALLSDLDPEEQAIPIVPAELALPADVPLDFRALDGDPRVAVQAVVPGIASAVTVGLGIAFAPGFTSDFSVLGAIPGAAGATGKLVTDGTIDPDLLVRTELVDMNGSRLGRRPRTSQMLPLFETPDVPVLRSPSPGGASGGSSYVLVFDDVLLDTFFAPETGLHRVILTDGTGRSWRLWRPDLTGGGGGDRIRIQVPNIGAVGGTPLADGTITTRISSYSWESFDFAGDGFLWTDIEREHDVFAHSFPVTFTQM